MPFPELLNPIQVTIEQMDRSEMVMDKATREPVPGARASLNRRITIQAQVKWETKDQQSAGPTGPEYRTRAYMTVLVADMLERSIVLKAGDRVLAIGELDMARSGLDLYLTGEVPLGAWSDTGGPTLTRWNIGDRQPVRRPVG